MFVDKVKVSIKAGDGGDGAVSFRHEKFIDRGGPDGGDGGDGGSVIFVASSNQDSLTKFRYQRELKAPDGRPGFKQRKHGRSGKDLVVEVPLGTVVSDDSGTVLADFLEDKQSVVIAKGGKGGFGNAHFISSTRQAPRVAEKGEASKAFAAVMELKMIADVGLVGLPNAGKSTLLARVSNARPEIADYPFTTLTPNLGVVDVGKDNSLLFADIPGLIEGASAGKGLGDAFLRHIERTAVLLHLIDAYHTDITTAYQTIQKELAAYEVDLTKRPQLVVLNKVEGLDKELIAGVVKELKKVMPLRTKVFPISAQSGEGLKELLFAVQKLVSKERQVVLKKQAEEGIPVIRLPENADAWQVRRAGNNFLITGKKIERFAARTDFTNSSGVIRLKDIMRKMGIMHELKRQGINPGDKIIIEQHDSVTY